MSSIQFSRTRRRAARGPHAQRGMSLFFALIALVALLLATLALVRSVDTGTLLVGNIGLKQDATASADQAARKAIDWLAENAANLNTNGASGSGYYASNLELAANGTTVQPQVDVTGRQLTTASRQLIDWGVNNKDNDSCASATAGTFSGGCNVKPSTATTVNGNTTRYVIFRLCSKPGDFLTDTTINCAKPMGAGQNTAQKRGDICYGGGGGCDPSRLGGSVSSPYYRIVVRVLGARNTASFTETIVHF